MMSLSKWCEKTNIVVNDEKNRHITHYNFHIHLQIHLFFTKLMMNKDVALILFLLLPCIDSCRMIWGTYEINYACILCSNSNVAFDITTIVHTFWFNNLSPIIDINALDRVILYSMLIWYLLCSLPYNIMLKIFWKKLCENSMVVSRLNLVRWKKVITNNLLPKICAHEHAHWHSLLMKITIFSIIAVIKYSWSCSHKVLLMINWIKKKIF